VTAKVAQRTVYHQLGSFSVGYFKIISVYDTTERRLLGYVKVEVKQSR